MAFHEVPFPDDISRGARGGPERRTQIVELASGDEERNASWANSRRRYDVAYGIRRADDLAAVVAFFEARNGRLHGFRFKDWGDHKSCLPSGTTTTTRSGVKQQIAAMTLPIRPRRSKVLSFISGPFRERSGLRRVAEHPARIAIFAGRGGDRLGRGHSVVIGDQINRLFRALVVIDLDDIGAADVTDRLRGNIGARRAEKFGNLDLRLAFGGLGGRRHGQREQGKGDAVHIGSLFQKLRI